MLCHMASNWSCFTDLLKDLPAHGSTFPWRSNHRNPNILLKVRNSLLHRHQGVPKFTSLERETVLRSDPNLFTFISATVPPLGYSDTAGRKLSCNSSKHQSTGAGLSKQLDWSESFLPRLSLWAGSLTVRLVAWPLHKICNETDTEVKAHRGECGIINVSDDSCEIHINLLFCIVEHGVSSLIFSFDSSTVPTLVSDVSPKSA